MEQFPTWTLTLLLGIIVILIVFFKTNLMKPKVNADDTSSAEDTLALFMDEWQKENEALLRTLSEMQNDVINRLSALQERVAVLEAKTTTENETVSGPRSQRERQERPGTELQHRYSDIFDMANNGMPVADIARKTGRGKGEIQLILGLAAREQPYE